MKAQYPHVNILEMSALCLVLQHFQDPLKGLHEIVQTHHTTVVFYINHNDGTK